MTYITMHTKQLGEFPDLHPMLKRVFWALVNLWPDDTMTITSIGRSWKQDRELGGSGVHAAGPPWRAMDLSIKTLTGGQAKADWLGERINEIFQYDPLRPHLKVAVTKPHGTGPHIHLQVHNSTVRKDA